MKLSAFVASVALSLVSNFAAASAGKSNVNQSKMASSMAILTSCLRRSRPHLFRKIDLTCDFALVSQADRFDLSCLKINIGLIEERLDL